MQSRKGHNERLTAIGKVHAETWTDENMDNNDSQKEREVKKIKETGPELIIQHIQQIFDRALNWCINIFKNIQRSWAWLNQIMCNTA